MGAKGRWKWLALAAAVAALAVVAVNLRQRETDSQAWASFLRGNPDAGGRVFFDKGCIGCHAISGTGGRLASDLGLVSDSRLTLGQLVGVMWNHAPDMWEAMKEHGLDVPRISMDEMTDLFAYLYFVRYLDEPGDPETGRRLLDEKQCTTCHRTRGELGRSGGDLKEWGAFDNPLLWTQRMWNHGAEMAEALKARGMDWPTFEGKEMVDLLAYIRRASSVPNIHVDYLPANPNEGERLFTQKSCSRCHPVRGQGGGGAPDLGRVPELPRTLTQVAGMMWNHSPTMWEAMAREGVARPEFTEAEMADLLAYLYAVSYFDEAGDAGLGKRLYQDKQCAVCHGIDGKKGSGGPDLSRWKGRASPLFVAYVMWRHGPKMYQKLKAQGTRWPRFEKAEMSDLLAYLNDQK